MSKYGENLKSAYALLNGGKLDEAKLAFEEIETMFKQDGINELDDDMIDYNNFLLGLGSLYMKFGKFEESLKYYIEGNELTKGKDFNILFNLGVVYKNLGNLEKSSEFLNEASMIDPTNPYLQKFLVELNLLLDNLNETKKLDTEEEAQSKKEINDSFEDKINDMIKNINK